MLAWSLNWEPSLTQLLDRPSCLLKTSPTTFVWNGSLWKNVVTEGKSKVAETLEEFRANYRYNLMTIATKRKVSTSDVLSRIYRNVAYGPLLELFFLDLRSYRGDNSENR